MEWNGNGIQKTSDLGRRNDGILGFLFFFYITSNDKPDAKRNTPFYLRCPCPMQSCDGYEKRKRKKKHVNDGNDAKNSLTYPNLA
jgi:hypothetical protein